MATEWAVGHKRSDSFLGRQCPAGDCPWAKSSGLCTQVLCQGPESFTASPLPVVALSAGPLAEAAAPLDSSTRPSIGRVWGFYLGAVTRPHGSLAARVLTPSPL